MSPTKEQVRNVSSNTELDSVKLKFEVIVIPVADAGRAKEFYGRLGRPRCGLLLRQQLPRRPVHPPDPGARSNCDDTHRPLPDRLRAST